jgi:hypothetical protein
MGDELDHIRKRLTAEGEKTIAFFESLSPEDWERRIYTTGSAWRVGDILAHFISAERAYQYYLQDILKGGAGAPDTLDIDQFNEAEVAEMSGTPVELLESFHQARQATIELTNEIEDYDLTKVANHPWFDEKEVGWFLKLMYRHNTMHRMDIRKSLKQGASLPHTGEHRTGRKIDPSN